MWHRQLLGLMSQEIPRVRPPVITSETAKGLDEFRKFRHLVRHVYTSQLDAARMKTLMDSLPSLWMNLRVELQMFIDFLHLLSHADEDAAAD